MSDDFTVPYGVVRAATKTFLGGTLAVAGTSMVSATIPMMAVSVVEGDVQSDELTSLIVAMSLSWISHWAIGCIMVFGFALLVVHVNLWRILVYEEPDPVDVLLGVALNQVVLSTAVTAIAFGDQYSREVLVAVTVAGIGAIILLISVLLVRMHNRGG